MVCADCESKLSRVSAPDPWKSGSRNTNETGRRVGESKLGKSFAARRFNPYATSRCSVCKQSAAQNGAKFCQPCAYAKGVCAICGKQVLDTRFYNMGDGAARPTRVVDPKEFHPEGWTPEGSPAAADAADGGDGKRPARSRGVAKGVRPGSKQPAASAAVAAPPAPAAGGATASAEAAGSGTGPADWQFDPATNLYFSVQAQAYYDSATAMYFMGGEWHRELPQQLPAQSQATPVSIQAAGAPAPAEPAD